MLKLILLLFLIAISIVITHGQPTGDYKLVFFDDFISSTLGGDWNVANCYQHNDERQLYIKENVFIETSPSPSKLVLVAKKENITCNGLSKNYTSGQVNMHPYLYGYFEIRAWTPGGCGAWPAFWFWSGWNNTQYSEIDVLESCGLNCNKYKVGYLWDNSPNGKADIIEHNSQVPNDGWLDIDNGCDDYNTYGLE